MWPHGPIFRPLLTCRGPSHASFPDLSRDNGAFSLLCLHCLQTTYHMALPSSLLLCDKLPKAERLCEPLASDIVYSIKEVLRKSVEWVPLMVLIVLSSPEVMGNLTPLTSLPPRHAVTHSVFPSFCHQASDASIASTASTLGPRRQSTPVRDSSLLLIALSFLLDSHLLCASLVKGIPIKLPDGLTLPLPKPAFLTVQATLLSSGSATNWIHSP